jgi:hypothetical protein
MAYSQNMANSFVDDLEEYYRIEKIKKFKIFFMSLSLSLFIMHSFIWFFEMKI